MDIETCYVCIRFIIDYYYYYVKISMVFIYFCSFHMYEHICMYVC